MAVPCRSSVTTSTSTSTCTFQGKKTERKERPAWCHFSTFFLPFSAMDGPRNYFAHAFAMSGFSLHSMSPCHRVWLARFFPHWIGIPLLGRSEDYLELWSLSHYYVLCLSGVSNSPLWSCFKHPPFCLLVIQLWTARESIFLGEINSGQSVDKKKMDKSAKVVKV